MLTKPKPGATINMAHPLSKGLVGFWLFNEGSGDLANDISGNKNHGTLKNMLPNAQGTKWCEGKSGGGLGFDGVEDYVDCGNDTSLDITDAITMEAWVKIPTEPGTGNSYHICGSGHGLASGISQGPYALSVDGNSKYIHFDIGNGSKREYVRYYFLPYMNGEWHSVIGLWDGTETSTALKLFINGNEVATGNVASGFGSLRTDKTFDIGKAGDADAYYFNGTIDEVKIYNRALSAKEIKTLYHNPFCNLLKIPTYQHYVLGAPHTNLGIGGIITDPSGNLIEGAIIKLENRTLGESLTNETSDVNGEYAMDLANLANQWSDGDVLILNAEARGYCQTVVTAADDSVPSLEVNFDNTIQRILMVM